MDIDLLGVRLGMWLDGRGRVHGLRGMVIAVAHDGATSWPGALLSDELAKALAAIVASSPQPGPAPEPPSVLYACERALSTALAAPIERHSGPCYVFPAVLRPVSPDARIVRSDAMGADDLRNANPGNWHAVEWDELLDGRLGPWAMATAGNDVLSICHTPVQMTEAAAECGVWTQPDARGRGYAAATASAWADILRLSGRHLFYHHDADNRSSQRVAQRLGLRPIGWTWRVGVDEPAGGAHPLSSEHG